MLKVECNTKIPESRITNICILLVAQKSLIIPRRNYNRQIIIIISYLLIISIICTSYNIKGIKRV